MGAEIPLQDHEQPVPHPPENESDRGPVPYAGGQEDDEQVDIYIARPAAPERNVQIIPEPLGQGHVPSPPELGDAPGDVRIVEVDLELEPEHFPESDGHLRITREVIEQLQGIADHAEPRDRRIDHLRIFFHDQRDRLAEDICQEHLLRQADDEDLDPVRKLLHAVGPAVQVRLDVMVPYDRPGDQLREHGYVQRQADQIPLNDPLGGIFRRIPVHVDHIGKPLECEKGDADGQRDVLHGK